MWHCHETAANAAFARYPFSPSPHIPSYANTKPEHALTGRVFWGTIGPQKQFGAKGQYKALLIGFPAGIILSLGTSEARLNLAPRSHAAIYLLKKKFPKSKFVRQMHPVLITFGGLSGAP